MTQSIIEFDFISLNDIKYRRDMKFVHQSVLKMSNRWLLKLHNPHIICKISLTHLHILPIFIQIFLDWFLIVRHRPTKKIRRRRRRSWKNKISKFNITLANSPCCRSCESSSTIYYKTCKGYISLCLIRHMRLFSLWEIWNSLRVLNK